MSNLRFIDSRLTRTHGELTHHYRLLETTVQEAETALRGYNQTRSELEGAQRARNQTPDYLRRHQESMVSATVRLHVAKPALYDAMRDLQEFLTDNRGNFELDGLTSRDQSWFYRSWVEQQALRNNLACTRELFQRACEIYDRIDCPGVDVELERLLADSANDTLQHFDCLPRLPVPSNRKVAALLVTILASLPAGDGPPSIAVCTNEADPEVLAAVVDMLRQKGWRIEETPRPDNRFAQGLQVRKPRRKKQS